MNANTTLVLGATGKTGSRIVERLRSRGVPVRTYLFSEVLDGRNASTADGVMRALGRAPRDFADYARKTAASGVWNTGAV